MDYFPKNFTYQDYEYILLKMIDHCRVNPLISFETNIRNTLREHFSTIQLQYILKCVVNSGYTIQDLQHIKEATCADTL